MYFKNKDDTKINNDIIEEKVFLDLVENKGLTKDLEKVFELNEIINKEITPDQNVGNYKAGKRRLKRCRKKFFDKLGFHFSSKETLPEERLDWTVLNNSAIIDRLGIDRDKITNERFTYVQLPEIITRKMFCHIFNNPKGECKNKEVVVLMLNEVYDTIVSGNYELLDDVQDTINEYYELF